MFGIYRTLLAIVVAVHHIVSIPLIGQYAVYGFFILSGYLMTYIMNNSYGYTVSGIKSYALNRFLRLYPPYWVVLIISLLIIIYWGEDQSKIYRYNMYIPSDLQGWIQNITLIFFNIFPSEEIPRISPPIWALTVELFFYLLIAIGVSKTKKSTLIWLIISSIYMTITHIIGLDYKYRYSILLAGSFPFSLGATVYHFREKLCNIFRATSKPLPIVLLFFCFLFNSFFSVIIKHYEWSEFLFYSSFYLNYLIHALLIISLIRGAFPFVNKKRDQIIGDYSYPIYLFHWQAGFFSAMIIWRTPISGLNHESVISFTLAAFICFFVSWIIINFVDQPIQILRVSIKEKASRTNSLRHQRSPLSTAY